MKYSVEPGIYAIGEPNKDSNIFVSANYKLSFDSLRKELGGIDAWILVLDTKGINVWCAAGKGTFGTDELVARIKAVKLNKIVSHKRLILPQLGATGVAAHRMKKESGFSVIYGPVRASDIKAFLANKMKATSEMRMIFFTFHDRIKLIGMEAVGGYKILLGAIVLISLLSIIKNQGISFEIIFNTIINILSAYFAGAILGPAFLPYWPGRAFSLKGISPGILLFALCFLLKTTGQGPMEIISWMLLIPTISSYMLMNFTGASTYTSLTGVMKEMRIAVPLQIIFAVVGLTLLVINIFI